MVKVFKILAGGVAAILLFVLLFVFWAYSMAFFPKDPFQEEAVSCPATAPELTKGQQIKIMSWNVQFMAGKNYTFFFEEGEDTRPLRKDIDLTIIEVARIINDENPDIILLQEMDEGAKRTDYENQFEKLLPLISSDYQCSTEAFYWKSGYVLHPEIMGSVGLKLITLSKFKINKGIRHFLAELPEFFLVQWFDLKRAVLEAQFPIVDGKDFSVMNTHLSAFAQGSDTMERQVKKVGELLQANNQKGKSWIIGGDFNLLPPGIDRQSLRIGDEIKLYKDETEISKILDHYKSAATISQLNGDDKQSHFTHFPNHKEVTGLDRTIDYIFYSDDLEFEDYKVRQEDTQRISDHMPLIMNFNLP